MTIAFARYHHDLMSVVDQAERLLARADTPDSPALAARVAECRARLLSDAPLRVALVGEFSSGKSSLISALTAAEVAVSADVCTTETKAFEWRGFTIIDTPGVQAQGDATDHDRIARQATVDADLVLFVVTNELFNPRLADHLRFILDDDGLGLAGKTALIINKVDRESNPPEVLRASVQTVLGPHQSVPVFLCAARKCVDARTAPDHLRDRFLRQSRIDDLIAGIDSFVDSSGAFGRLTAPLQVIEDVLADVRAALAPTDTDRTRVELARRQKTVLQRLQTRLLELRRNWKQQAFSAVLQNAESAVEQVNELTTKADLQGLLDLGLAQAAAQVEGLHDGVAAEIASAFDEAQEKLDAIGASPLAQAAYSGGSNRVHVDIAFTGTKPDSGRSALAHLAKNSAPTVSESLEWAAQNSEQIAKLIQKAGKSLGKKVGKKAAEKAGARVAQTAGKVSKALPLIATALEFYMQYREEKAKEEKARYLASLRQALRNAFAQQAQDEAQALADGIDAVCQSAVAEALADVDARVATMTGAEAGREEIAAELALLIRRSTMLRSAILGARAVGDTGAADAPGALEQHLEGAPA